MLLVLVSFLHQLHEKSRLLILGVSSRFLQALRGLRGFPLLSRISTLGNSLKLVPKSLRNNSFGSQLRCYIIRPTCFEKPVENLVSFMEAKAKYSSLLLDSTELIFSETITFVVREGQKET
jgi:hypothetical protein